jgi:hypothetical protein
MPSGPLLAEGVVYSVICPLGVIFPILSDSLSVNHWLPSKPAVISPGKLLAVGMVYSVTVPGAVAALTRLAALALATARLSTPTIRPAIRLNLMTTVQNFDARMICSFLTLLKNVYFFMKLSLPLKASSELLVQSMRQQRSENKIIHWSLTSLFFVAKMTCSVLSCSHEQAEPVRGFVPPGSDKDEIVFQGNSARTNARLRNDGGLQAA